MDQLNYDSNEDDDFSVEDVEYEAGNYDDHDGDLPAISDLEFIAANAADAFEFIDTGANMLEEAPEKNVSSSGESDDESESDHEDGMAVETAVAAEESSSDDSSDSEDEIVTDKQYQKKSKQISWLTEEEGDEAATGPLKTKNELEEEIEVVEVKQLEISDSSDLVCVGEVKYRIDHECVVVIQADYTTNALNEGSVLCNVDGKILGKIQEIFGPITTPFYTVRWKNPSAQSSGNNGNQGKNNKNKNNKKKGKGGQKGSETAAIEAATLAEDPIVPDAVAIEIENDNSLEQKTAQETALVTDESNAAPEAVLTEPTEKAVVVPKPATGLEIAEVRALFPVGAKLYTVRSHCSFVLAAQLEKARAKGSDASNAYDEEPPEEEMEFSDDEKEMEAKLARKQAKKGQTGPAPADASTFGDAIPPGGRFGANKRNLQGGRPNAARPTGSSSAGTGATQYPQHQQFPQQAMQPQPGYYPQQPPGAPMSAQAYGTVPAAYGMNPGYMGAPYMPPQQQAYYGQAPMQPQMSYGMPYGANPAGYPMQPQYAAPGMHAYPAQQPMYPPQPMGGHMLPPHQQQQQQQQYAPQPGFLPAAAFVTGAYNQQSAQQPQGQNQGQQPPLPQYQYQPLPFNNGGNTKK